MATKATKAACTIVSHMDTIGRIDFDPVAVKAAYTKATKELLEKALAARGWTVAEGSEAEGFIFKKSGMDPIGGFYINPAKVKAKAKAKAPAQQLADMGLTPSQLKKIAAILKE